MAISTRISLKYYQKEKVEQSIEYPAEDSDDLGTNYVDYAISISLIFRDIRWDTDFDQGLNIEHWT